MTSRKLLTLRTSLFLNAAIFLILFAGSFVSLLLYIISSSVYLKSPNDSLLDQEQRFLISRDARTFPERVASYRRCLLQDHKHRWNNFINVVKSCTNDLTTISRDKILLLPTGRLNEKKPILPFRKGGPKRVAGGLDCVSLTVGIAGDIAAEQQLLQMYPGCKLFGVERNVADGSSFIKVGTYFPFELSGIAAPPSSDGDAITIPPKMDLVHFIAMFMPTSTALIHFGTFMQPGSGRRFLPAFRNHQKAARTFCQLEVLLESDTVNFQEDFQQFIEESDYVPIFAGSFNRSQSNFRVTFVNIDTGRRCFELFDLDAIFEIPPRRPPSYQQEIVQEAFLNV